MHTLLIKVVCQCMTGNDMPVEVANMCAWPIDLRRAASQAPAGGAIYA